MSQLVVLGLLLAGAAGLPDGDSLLRRIDANIGSENKVLVAEMRIHGRRGSRTVRVKSWVSGTDRSFTEYLAPERERGTKMLKLGSQLWTYSPESDRTIMISGHMLRQSVSGSDLSYEDLMEDPRLVNLYSAATEAADTAAERPAWRLMLTARSPDVAYQSRRLWVDRERPMVLREERFSKSGRLLKATEVREVRRFDGRWVAAGVLFRDMLREGGGTEMTVDSLRFDVAIPDHLFTKAALRR